MMFKTHIAAGAAASIAASTITTGSVALVPLGAAVVGSLLPDIDHPNSYLGKRVPGASHLIYIFGGHRGFTHSLPGFALFALVATLIAWLYPGLGLIAAAHFALGYASHLLLDAVSGGVPLIWPIKHKFGVRLAQTGGLGEYFVAFPGLLAVSYFFVAYWPSM